MLKLKSIEEEKQDCIKAFEKAQIKVGDFVLHCHHDILYEILCYSYMDRINFIIQNKTDNVALRLRLFRPIPKDNNMCENYYKAYENYCKARENYEVCENSYEARENYYEAIENYKKAYDNYKKACEAYLTTHISKNDPWNGKTIFANGFELEKF